MRTSKGHDDDAYQVSDEKIHQLLGNKRRRAVLDILQNQDQIDVRSLSEQIAELEAGPDEQPNRQSVYVSLHQTHLPTLDKHGIIEYDQDRQVVSAKTMDDRIERLLDIDDTEEQETSRTIIGVILITGVMTVGYGVFDSITTLLILAIVWVLLSGALIAITRDYALP